MPIDLVKQDTRHISITYLVIERVVESAQKVKKFQIYHKMQYIW